MSATASIIRSVHDGSTPRVKDVEKSEILATISEAPGISRKAIGLQHGYRPSTVSLVVQELLDDGLVAERRPAISSRKGRPEIGLTIRSNRLYVVAVYTVSHQIRAALVNLANEVVQEEVVDASPEWGNRELAHTISALVGTLRASFGNDGDLLGMSLALPGYVDQPRRRWIYAARWPKMKNLDIHKIEKETGLSSVVTQFPDAELEHLVLAHPDYAGGGTLLFHWGYGIGASYAHNGQVLRSSQGGFLEIGHWKIHEAAGRQCACGAIGCVETVAAMWALLPAFRQAYPDCPEDEYLFAEFVENINVNSTAILQTALAVVSRVLAHLYGVFLPDRVLAFGPFLRNRRIFRSLQEQMRLQVPDYLRDRLTLLATGERFHGSVIGSVAPIFRKGMQDLLTARW